MTILCVFVGLTCRWCGFSSTNASRWGAFVFHWLFGGMDFPTQTHIEEVRLCWFDVKMVQIFTTNASRWVCVLVLVWHVDGVDFPTQTHASGLRCVCVVTYAPSNASDLEQHQNIYTCHMETHQACCVQVCMVVPKDHVNGESVIYKHAIGVSELYISIIAVIELKLLWHFQEQYSNHCSACVCANFYDLCL